MSRERGEGPMAEPQLESLKRWPTSNEVEREATLPDGTPRYDCKTPTEKLDHESPLGSQHAYVLEKVDQKYSQSICQRFSTNHQWVPSVHSLAKPIPRRVAPILSKPECGKTQSPSTELEIEAHTLGSAVPTTTQ